MPPKQPHSPGSDDPFNARPEDFLNREIRAGVGALPVIGSGLTEFLAFVVGDPAQERRDDFMRATMDRLMELQDQFDQLDKEALRANEQFQATFIQATRLCSQTASDEKRAPLQNAIINSAILGVEENLRQILMQFLERITPLHAILSLFDNPKANDDVLRISHSMMGGLSLIVEAAIPAMRGNRAIADRVVSDFEAMGLLSGANLNVTMSGSGLVAQRTTPLGRSFLKFIGDPESGSVPAP